MQDITLAEWEKLGDITAHTKAYLEGMEVREKCNRLLRRFVMGARISIRHLQVCSNKEYV